MATLYLMCGLPGAGKSTFVRDHMNPITDIYVSRDEIRFKLVKENEEYFSKEKEVFRNFVYDIEAGLIQNYDVFADATHINFASRKKLLNAINKDIKAYTSIEAIWVKVPKETALKQNENRKGTRSYVPPEAISRMCSQFQRPEFEEGFSTIYVVEPNKPIEVYRKEDYC